MTEAASANGGQGAGGADLDTILSRVPALAGTPRTVSELPGGLTNRNYKVTTPDGSFVARLWSHGDLLAINRDHEYHNSVAAAQAGVGAPVLAYHPDDSLLVLGYIDGRTYGNDDVSAPGNIARIARACRQLHDGPRFRGEFNVFTNQRRYRSVAREHGFAIPAGYDDLMPRVEDARKALAGHRPVVALVGEHVELTAEPRPGVQLPACPGDTADVARSGHVVVAVGAPVDVAEHEQAVAGVIGDHGGADAGLRRGHRVVVLVIPVDSQQVPAGPDPGHERAVRRGHLVVPVGEPAGQLGHCPGGPGQGRNPAQDRVQLSPAGALPAGPARGLGHEMRVDPVPLKV